MSLVNTIGLVRRAKSGARVEPDLFSVGAGAELLYGGGTPFASSSNPAAVDVKATGVSLGRSFRASGTVSTGVLNVVDAGIYEVSLMLDDHSEGSASGNVQYDVVYAPDGVTFAAFSATETAGGGGRMQALSLALTTSERLHCSRWQLLNGGSKVLLRVTSAAGGVCTITDGRLRITKIFDVDPPTNA